MIKQPKEAAVFNCQSINDQQSYYAMNVQPKVGHSNKISTQKLMCVDEKPLLHSKEIILKPHLSQTPSNNMGCLERKESSNAY
mmetsp:Transcript_138/g.101  ORF Transcript_138/g.101 Transcript_138/m.101 type:complete len:83 (+) Transcript_138:122-370(+)